MEKTLIQRMIEVRKSVDYLQKENANRQQGFNYVSSSQVLAAIRKAMNEQGVILIPSIEASRITEKTMSNGGIWYLTELDLTYTWINADDPKDTIQVKWYGQGLDSSEKGPGKALTYAEKYLILKTFLIPTDKDDPDAWEGKTAGGENPKDQPPAGRQQGQTRGNQGGQKDRGGPPATDKQLNFMLGLAEKFPELGKLAKKSINALLDQYGGRDKYTVGAANQDIETLKAGNCDFLVEALDAQRQPAAAKDDDIPF